MDERMPFDAPGEYAARVKKQLETRCIHLLTKESFLGLPSDHEQQFPVDEAIFWCDSTGDALGPDGCSACVDDCHGKARSCYEPPLRFEDPA